MSNDIRDALNKALKDNETETLNIKRKLAPCDGQWKRVNKLEWLGGKQSKLTKLPLVGDRLKNKLTLSVASFLEFEVGYTFKPTWLTDDAFNEALKNAVCNIDKLKTVKGLRNFHNTEYDIEDAKGLSFYVMQEEGSNNPWPMKLTTRTYKTGKSKTDPAFCEIEIDQHSERPREAGYNTTRLVLKFEQDIPKIFVYHMVACIVEMVGKEPAKESSKEKTASAV